MNTLFAIPGRSVSRDVAPAAQYASMSTASPVVKRGCVIRDDDGEGGVLALMALLGVKRQRRPAIVALGLFGAPLIYGDGAITPAISVLSALEGLL
jgi:K+ potassium transporter